MKKITLFILSGFFVCIADAQFTKGEKYLSGSFYSHFNDYDLNDHDGTESVSILFSPSFSKFVSGKKAIGLKVNTGYQYGKMYSSDTTRSTLGQLGVGVFSQNYLDLKKGFYLLLEKGITGNVALSHINVINAPSANSDLTSYSLSVYLTPGIGYKLSDRLIVGLNLGSIISAGYTHTKVKYTTSTARINSLQVFSSLNNINLGSVGITFGWKLK